MAKGKLAYKGERIRFSDTRVGKFVNKYVTPLTTRVRSLWRKGWSRENKGS